MPAKTPTKTPTKPAPAAKPAKAAAGRMTLAEVMSALEKAGSAQTRKTYARHGAKEPMFGVAFAVLKTLAKRIKVDHELALALWETGNVDARNLAVKVVDPARMTPADLDRWAKGIPMRMCGAYVTHLAAEGAHGRAKAEEWLASGDDALRCVGWGAVAALARIDEAMPDAWFAARLAAAEKGLHEAPSPEREARNHVVIATGGRNQALRRAALAAAKRIGAVEVDHGDTACKTPDAATYIEKMWAHADAKGAESPSAQERARESMRTRC